MKTYVGEEATYDSLTSGYYQEANAELYTRGGTYGTGIWNSVAGKRSSRISKKQSWQRRAIKRALYCGKESKLTFDRATRRFVPTNFRANFKLRKLSLDFAGYAKGVRVKLDWMEEKLREWNFPKSRVNRRIQFELMEMLSTLRAHKRIILSGQSALPFLNDLNERFLFLRANSCVHAFFVVEFLRLKRRIEEKENAVEKSIYLHGRYKTNYSSNKNGCAWNVKQHRKIQKCVSFKILVSIGFSEENAKEILIFAGTIMVVTLKTNENGNALEGYYLKKRSDEVAMVIPEQWAQESAPTVMDI